MCRVCLLEQLGVYVCTKAATNKSQEIVDKNNTQRMNCAMLSALLVCFGTQFSNVLTQQHEQEINYRFLFQTRHIIVEIRCTNQPNIPEQQYMTDIHIKDTRQLSKYDPEQKEQQYSTGDTLDQTHNDNT